MQAEQKVAAQDSKMSTSRRIVLKINGPDIQQSVVLDTNKEYSIGRTPECDIYLNDERVSRHHASLHFEDEQWVLRDMKSVNQILTNEGLVAELNIEPGVNFQIGPVQFTVHNEGELLSSLSDLSDKLQGKKRRVVLLAVALISVIFAGILMFGSDDKSSVSEGEEIAEKTESKKDSEISSVLVDAAAAKKSKQHYYLAIQNYDTRNLENAIRELELALKSNPNNVAAKKKFAEIEREIDAEITRHYQQGCFHAKFLRRYEAEQEFQTVVQMIRNKTDGRYLESKRMLDLLDVNDAVSLRCGESAEEQ